MEIERKIKQIRKMTGMTQQSFANELMVSTSAIGMYEQGRRNPPAKFLQRVVQRFCIDAAAKSSLDARFEALLIDLLGGAAMQSNHRILRCESMDSIAPCNGRYSASQAGYPMIASSMMSCGDNRQSMADITSLMRRIIDNELTMRQRRCVVSKYFYGKTTTQIALEMGLSPSTVSNHTYAGICRLRKYLGYFEFLLRKGVSQ